MSYDTHDTIAAIGTASGGAARGMIRISGPATLDVISRCFANGAAARSKPRKHSTVVYGDLTVKIDERSHQLPCDLFLWPTDRSYTRQPVAEFHLPGSPPVLQSALEAVCRAGARLAEPGEFTLRAFLAGRLDLTQAEAVLGVIDARHADQFDAALRQLAGGLVGPLQQLREELLDALARLEAGLDFVEEDIEFIAPNELVARLARIAAEIDAVAAQMASRHTVETTCRVVLVGPPNAGKSSLFNALATRFAAESQAAVSAIVSAERGTTRDYLTATIDLGGVRCELVDTAGIEDDPAIGIATSAQALGRKQHERAVLRAYCVEAANSAECVVPPVELVIVTKCDLVRRAEQIGAGNIPPTVLTSSVTGTGLDVLRQVISGLLGDNAASTASGCVDATADRCRDSLRLASAAISRAIEVAASRGGDELVAVELRFCLDELGKVVGAVYTDDILDRIFKTFCIGK